MKAVHEMMLPSDGGFHDVTAGSIYFIGTATVLIRYAGFTILTDPNFIHRHESVSIGYGLHATRLTDPAMEIYELPPLDLVLLSHFHGDHFDQVAERELNKSLPIVTTTHAARALGRRGFRELHPLKTWSDIELTKGNSRLRIIAAPGAHGPALVNPFLPPVMGSILEFESGSHQVLFRMYITGDTLPIKALRQIPRRYPEIDLALLHLGDTRVLGVLVTMDGKQGVEVMRMIDPRLAIPIHYNDYDRFKSPLTEFQHEVETAGLGRRVHYLRHGETYTFRVMQSRLAA